MSITELENDLAEFSVGLAPLTRVGISSGMRKALHGLFYALIKEADINLAEAVHSSAGVDPIMWTPLDLWERSLQC